MKKLSKLTALLLAVIMLFGTMPVSALATTIPMTEYQAMKIDAQEANEGAVVTEGGEVVAYETGDNVVNGGYETTTEVSLAANAAGSEGEKNVTLSQYSMVVLKSAIADGKWQVQVGNQWVTVAGETGSSFAVTYAKVESLFDMNGYAKVRHISADGSKISEVANIGIAYGALSIPEVEENLEKVSYIVREDSADAQEDVEPGKVIVEIAYEFQNGEMAASSYTAEIGQGDDLITSVISLPVVQGYKATFTPVAGATFVAPSESDPGSIQLTLSNVEANQTFTVVYVPDYVPFKVNHLLMGFDSEQSTAVLDKTETFNNLKTGEAVGAALADEYDGFTALWYNDTTTVAADGSTVINIYYERNWYLMLFDLDDGYGVDPIYAQYGATIEVGTPTKAGYSFKGWSLDGTTVVDLPEEMPDENTTYKAVWEVGTSAKVSVVFWGENADDEGYSYISTTEIQATPETELDYETAMTDCGQSSHQHTDACYACDQEEHTHTSACYSCGQEEHTHVRGCYTASGGTLSSTPVTDTNTIQNLDNAEPYYSNGVYITQVNYNWEYYVKIGSYYYQVTFNYNQSARNFAYTTNCGKTEHTHGDSCSVSCGKSVHTHSDSCGIDCGKTEHTHSNGCYLSIPLDTDLYYYVRSDTVTVAADGSTVMNVYFDRVTYNVEFHSNQNCTNEYTSLRITAKWGQNILSKWPTYNGSSSWKVQGKDDTWQNSIQVMPVGGAKFWGPKTGNSSHKAYYYVEALPGAEDTITHNNVTYILHHTDTSVSSGNVTDEERYGIDGFTYKEGTANGQSYSNAKFYYTRNSYNLVFNDGYDDVKTESVKFEAPLSPYADYVPAAPSAYEPGSVTFAGWYLNPECTGEQYNLSTSKMPSKNVLLYAKWELVEHDVVFYTKQEDIANNAAPIVPTFKVTHYDTVSGTVEDLANDEVAGNEVTIPTDEQMAAQNGNYSFVGWFYTDTDGTEKAFDPDTMPVTKDLVIYGKWNATEPVGFRINYVLATLVDGVAKPVNAAGEVIEEGPGAAYVYVADSLVSQALDGTTITEEAKTGDELYADYRTGYFPYPPSHSVEILVSGNNEYNFLYVPADKVPYKVVYLLKQADGSYVEYAETPYVMHEDNRNVIVTENYLRIPGYRPDAFQKRLIVSYPGTTVDNGNQKTDPELGENIIFFYYEEDTVNAYWSVTHYIEPIGGVTADAPWQQYGVTESYLGTIGQEQTAQSKTIEGFKLDTIRNEVDFYYRDDDPKLNQSTNLTAVLTSGGMDFRLYYVREEYPIKVQYLEQGTNNVLAAAELFNNEATYDYQADVNVITTKQFSGYTMVSPNTQPVTIQVDGKTLSDVTKNVVTFYYKKDEVEINYVAVGPDSVTTDANIGSVTPTTEAGTNGNGVVTALDGPVTGSTATAGANYNFVGWYATEECDGTALTTNAQYVPQKVNDLYESATYYAKFEEKQVTINYVPRFRDANGTVDAATDAIGTVTPESETLNVLTGEAQGSTAEAAVNTYRFVGWYSDEACTDANKLIGDASYVPTKEANTVWVNGTTYYALFEYNLTTLTVEKTGLSGGESAIVEVTIDGVPYQIALNSSNGWQATIENVLIGSVYSVTEKTDWTWRYGATITYADEAVNGAYQLDVDADKNKVTIKNDKNNNQWLDDEAGVHNDFKDDTATPIQ